MNYLKRELERKFLKMNEAFKVILVTGARQVGKTTMLIELAKDSNRTFVTMDDANIRELARTEPKIFFQRFEPPLIIDEVQKAPELFDVMKEICDKTEEKGLFWLTGSESKKLLQCANDSLAGRVCILRMFSLSQREKMGLVDIPNLNFDLKSLIERQKFFPPNNINTVYEHIFKGGMPGTINYDDEQLFEFYSSYIDNYLMRDAVDDNFVLDTVGFRRMLVACASFIGCVLNYSDLAQASGVSVPTAKNWVKILQNMGIIFLLDTYSNNALKRLVKAPKLYFCDTGLCAYLSLWNSKDVLMNGAFSGHFFENYVVGEILRNYKYSSSRMSLTYYRDTNQKEIDLVLEENGKIYPIEIKRTSNPDKRIVKVFDVLKKTDNEIGNGIIISMIDNVLPIDENNINVPCNII